MDLMTWGGRAKLGQNESSIDIYRLLNVKQLAGGKQQHSTHREIGSVLYNDLEGSDREDGREAQEGGDMGTCVCTWRICFVVQ